jgi:hypothetical protein
MKKVFFFSLAIMATACLNVFAYSINSYNGLRHAILDGQQLVILLDFQKITKQQSGWHLGYFIPNSMMIVPGTGSIPRHVVTSQLHFTDRSGVPTYEYVKYTFYDNDSVKVEITFYDAKTFTPLESPHALHCSFGQGIKVKTVSEGTPTYHERDG